MERRTFLKAAAASLMAALEPFKQLAAEPAVVIDGFATADLMPDLTPDYDVHHYAAQQVVVLYETGLGLLAQDALLTTYTLKENRKAADQLRSYAEFTFTRLVGPVGYVCRFMNQYGDVTRTKENELRLGFRKTDGTSLWVGMHDCVLTHIGCSVTAREMLISDCVRGQSAGIPTITDATRTQPITEVTQAEIDKQLAGYPVPGIR